MAGDFEIFLVAVPGLEATLCAEAKAAGFLTATEVKGGVTIAGGWPDVWRANLVIRGASRILARVGSFRAFHLAQLDKRARRVEWGKVLRPDTPFRVEVTCKASRIYHSGAAAQRIERAVKETLGSPISADAEVCLKVRIEDDLVTLGVDTSGEPLHKRGFKHAVAKAPMRETMAALILRQCGFTGSEPILDPMCGSGTFVIEAAEIACGLYPGRARNFAFEQLATFDAATWQALRTAGTPRRSAITFHGSDRDAGAVAMSRANAERAGVGDVTDFRLLSIEEVVAPDGPAGLVIVNPPYGARIGDKSRLLGLYRALGHSMSSRFKGWRIGLVTSEADLVRATGLPFAQNGPPILHGGLRVALYSTGPLG